MSDIFQEVDEDLRREHYARLWKRYGIYVIAGCLLIVLVAAAVVGWRSWRDHESRKASLAYQAIVHAGEEDATVLTLDDAAKLEAAEKALPRGYRLLADMERAASYVAAKKFSDAIALYERIADDGAAPKQLREVAAIKSAYLQAEALTLDQMKARVGALAVAENGFRFSANELLGYAAYRTGDYKSARDYYQAIVSDADAPQSLRQRAQDMLGLTSSKMPSQPAASAPAQASQ